MYSNFKELGEGIIDLKPILKLIKDNGYDGYITVELDFTRTTNKDSATKSMEYLLKNL